MSDFWMFLSGIVTWRRVSGDDERRDKNLSYHSSKDPSLGIHAEFTNHSSNGMLSS